jgi:hypothetical protein
MQLARPVIAIDPRRFGRACAWHFEMPRLTSAFSDDLKLFATAYAAAFLFVSILIY